MLALPRHDFANCSVLSGPPGFLYLLKAKSGRSYLLEKDLSSHRNRTVAVLEAHLHPALAYAEGQIFILGGTDECEGRVYKDCVQVEGKLGGVQRLPDLVYSRGKAAAVRYQRSLYIFGGYEEVWRDGQAKFRLSNTIEKLNNGNWVIATLGGSTSGSQANSAIFELSLAGETAIQVGKCCALEEGMPVEGEATRLGFLFKGRRYATEKVVEMRVEWEVWELRRVLLYTRLKLQRLALF